MVEEASSKHKMRRLRPLLGLLLILVLPFAWLGADMLNFVRTPASAEPVEVVVHVPVGISLPALSDLLQDRGLVSSGVKFRWLIRFKGADQDRPDQGR